MKGKKSLFASDVTKQMFDKVLPVVFSGAIHPVRYKVYEVDRNGFHYSDVVRRYRLTGKPYLLYRRISKVIGNVKVLKVR